MRKDLKTKQTPKSFRNSKDEAYPRIRAAQVLRLDPPFVEQAMRAKKLSVTAMKDVQVESSKPLKDGRLQITFAASPEAQLDFDRLKDLLAHRNFSRQWGEFFHQAVRIALVKLDPPRKSAPAQKPASKETLVAKREYLSVHSVRTVRDQSGSRCDWTDPSTGRRCKSTHGIQTDHIIMVAENGTNEIRNLRTLCGAHNRYVARLKGYPAGVNRNYN